MRVLIVKTSSMGDVIHTLPALTDAMRAIPAIRFDWVVEQAFGEIPSWHPAVENVIPIALRRWRKAWGESWRSGDMGRFTQRLRRERYDLIIDAQGLFIKSALVAAMAKGPRAGFDRRSARDPRAAWTYQRRYRVAKDLHAVERIRRLFAQALGYGMPKDPADFGLNAPAAPGGAKRPYVVFLHGTTWPSKHYPELLWAELSRQVLAAGYQVRLPWGNEAEQARAHVLASTAGVELIPRGGLGELAGWLASAAGFVGVDTGLSHLAAALEIPGVCLYGPTRPDLTGALGPYQLNLSADFECAPCLKRDCAYPGARSVDPPCFGSLSPHRVWQRLQGQIALKGGRA